MDTAVEDDVVRFARQQRAAESGEPTCVVCGRYGAFICDATDDDVCSLECRDLCMNTPQRVGEEESILTKRKLSSEETNDPTIVMEMRKRFQIHLDGVGAVSAVLTSLCDSFESLPIELRRNMTTRGLEHPTPVQMQTIPVVLSGAHVVVTAPTGTGKTAAFLIPITVQIMEMRFDRNESVPLGLVLAPIRELAMQIEHDAKTLMKGIAKMKTALVVGGLPIPSQLHRLRQGVQLIVATPGRLVDILMHHDVDAVLDHIQCCVVDEVDMMFSIGFREAITQILGTINTLPQRVQLIFTSATMAQYVETLVASSLGSNPAYVRIRVGELVGVQSSFMINTNMNHSVQWAEENDKKTELFRILQDRTARQTLVFVESRVGADMLVEGIERHVRHVRARAFHAGKSQQERLEILEDFVNEKCEVLVTTNVLGRGIDVLTVDFVVIFDAPRSMTDYVHLIGRVGRGLITDETTIGASTMFVNTRDTRLFAELVQTFRSHRLSIPERVYSTLRAHQAQQKRRDAVPQADDDAKRSFRLLHEGENDDISSRASAWESWKYMAKRTRYT